MHHFLSRALCIGVVLLGNIGRRNAMYKNHCLLNLVTLLLAWRRHHRRNQNRLHGLCGGRTLPV
jgi:hypothetical protein